MKKILPSVELWQEDGEDMIARAARVCYAASKPARTSSEMCERLRKNNHMSMFRHGSVYFVVPRSKVAQDKQWVFLALQNSPYVGVRYCKQKKDGEKERVYFISTNCQFSIEHEWLVEVLGFGAVSEQAFIEYALQYKFYPALSLVRYTVCVTTQISTSRELNRTSPNNIAEQSTRYVNFWKKGGGITICLPHWYEKASWWKKALAKTTWQVAEWAYKLLLKAGLPPEDARTALPIDTATRVVYTYNVSEWRHILNLRLVGTTGKPHPNARITAQQIHDAILPLMRIYGGEKARLISE